MTRFELDPRLANDCIVLGELNTSILLLMNNSLIPWFILVPQTSELEFTDLSPAEQQQLQNEINLVASFIKSDLKISKLNIATIGNIVSQLHIHIVGRHASDYCWPNVVWGTTECVPYSEQRVNEIIKQLKKQLSSNLTVYLTPKP